MWERTELDNFIEPVRTYNRLITVDGKATVRNIFVLPKLTLPDDKLLVVETVSYTHLDVYKRQTLTNLDLLNLIGEMRKELEHDRICGH